jgi:hypothetical protein
MCHQLIEMAYLGSSRTELAIAELNRPKVACIHTAIHPWSGDVIARYYKVEPRRAILTLVATADRKLITRTAADGSKLEYNKTLGLTCHITSEMIELYDSVVPALKAINDQIPARVCGGLKAADELYNMLVPGDAVLVVPSITEINGEWVMWWRVQKKLKSGADACEPMK